MNSRLTFKIAGFLYSLLTSVQKLVLYKNCVNYNKRLASKGIIVLLFAGEEKMG